MFICSARLSRILPVLGIGVVCVIALIVLLAQGKETGIPVQGEADSRPVLTQADEGVPEATEIAAPGAASPSAGANQSAGSPQSAELPTAEDTGRGEAMQVSGVQAGDADSPEGRLRYLRSCGWLVDRENEQAEAVTIPAEFDAVYRAYNSLQVTQGFDLTPYAGQTAVSHTYRILNYPGQALDVYAELLVRGGEVIGAQIYATDNSDVRHGLIWG